MENQGWIKLHRKVRDSSCYNDPNPWVFKIWMECCMAANYHESTGLRGGREINILPGQFLYSRSKWAKRMKIPEGTLRNVIEKLQKWDMIQDKGKDKGLATIFQIKNWEAYQSEDKVLDIVQDKVRTKSGQSQDISKNNKNNNNEKKVLPKARQDSVGKGDSFTPDQEEAFTRILVAYKESTFSDKRAIAPETKRNIVRWLEYHAVEDIVKALKLKPDCKDTFLSGLAFDTLFRHSNGSGPCDYLEQILTKF